MNTCPPVLIASGAAPGILCQGMTGDTCADTEQFCECGQPTIEGRPWVCVPTVEECPDQAPEAGSACAGAPDSCDYVVDGERTSCSCSGDQWACEASRCPIQRPLNAASCAGDAGLECTFFISAATEEQPTNAYNLSCSCGEDERWSCDDGCPATFPGEGAECDADGPVNCSWLEGGSVVFCGCNGVWNCL